MAEKQDNSYLSGLRNFAVFVLFTACGAGSSYLFIYPRTQFWMMHGPGILYTLSTVILFFIAGIKLKPLKLLIYLVAMHVTYMAAFFSTISSGATGLFFGIIFCGLGAMLTFIITRKLIQPFGFNMAKVFLCGAIPFILMDLILIINPIEYFLCSLLMIPDEYNSSLDILGITLFFWQVIVGIVLYVHLTSENKTSNHE